MSVVKINAITVPKERADELVARFAARAGEVSSSPGFEAFELLRPTDDRDTFLVYTRWASEDDFQAWMNSAAFQHGHKAHGEQGPVSTQQRAVAVRRRPARGRAAPDAEPPRLVETLLDFHKVWGYVAIVAERDRRRRSRWSRGGAKRGARPVRCGSRRSSPRRR